MSSKLRKITQIIVDSKKGGAYKTVVGTNNNTNNVGSIMPQKSRRGRNADNLTPKLLLASQG